MKVVTKRSTLAGQILIPASKSHTIRAIAIATLAEGKSVLRNPLESADTRSAFGAAEEFGAQITVESDKWIIGGTGGSISPKAKIVDVANSGTSLRIFAALAALGKNKITFDGDHSIRKRSMTPLLSALRNLGAVVTTENDKCPFTIHGPLRGGKTPVDGISSQFLTALLLSTPLSVADTEIIVENLHEKPYVEITLDWLRRQSIRFEHHGLEWFHVYGNQHYTAFDRQIPGDFSSGTFALCAAAITGSEILINGLDFRDHQGDKKVFTFLKNMGTHIEHRPDGVFVRGGELNGIDIDMNDTPDALPAMAVVGCFAKGSTRLFNVAQARLKECDRIAAAKTELEKMGARITELDDGLIIEQSKLKGTAVHGHDDHRIIMSLAIAGMAATGETVVDTAESIKITYPSFVRDMDNVGARIGTVND